MPAPTGIIGFSLSTPAAPSGRQNALPQTDGGSPLQKFTFNFPNGGGGGVEYRTTTTESLGQADQGKVISFKNASAIAVTINTPTDSGWQCAVFVTGAGQATFTPSSGTINGGASIILTTDQNCVIWWDGTNYLATLAGGPGTGLLLQVNGVNNGSQTELNLAAGTGISIVDGGSGTVTISTASFGPNPSPRRWAYGSSCNSALNSTAGAWTGDSGQAAGSTIAATGAIPGSFPNLPVPTTSFNSTSTSTHGSLQSNMFSASAGWTLVGKNMFFQIRLALSAITSIRIRIGVGAIGSVATWIASDSLTTTPYASFRFSTSASDTDWMCETGTGSAVNTASSGVAAATGSLLTLGIKFNDSVPNVVFYINGTAVYTSTTDLPPTGTPLSFIAAFIPLLNISETLYIANVYEEADA